MALECPHRAVADPLREVSMMDHRRSVAWFAIACAACFAASVVAPAFAANRPAEEPPPQRTLKKRIAVDAVDVQIENWTWFAASTTVTGGLTEMLTTALWETGRFVVVERAALESINEEQDLAAEGRTTEETGAQTGKLLGAEFRVRGVMTEFEASKGGGGGGIRIGPVAVGGSKARAHIGLDVRVYNTSTGEIVGSKHVAGTAERGSGAVGFSSGIVDVRAEGFEKTPLGKAMRDACTKWVQFVVEELGDQPWEGRVVTSNEKGVYINAGSELGIQVGDSFEVYREGEALIDPATGLELAKERERVGALRVTQVEAKFSICEPIEGDTFERNDVVQELALAE